MFDIHANRHAFAMFDTSYRIILSSLLSMIIAGGLLFFDTATIVAYALLVIGFFGIGIGILIGFIKMIKESD
ncbi:MAG: hypothetical protein WBO18_10540 [Gammaproteobacteria bacterium]